MGGKEMGKEKLLRRNSLRSYASVFDPTQLLRFTSFQSATERFAMLSLNFCCISMLRPCFLFLAPSHRLAFSPSRPDTPAFCACEARTMCAAWRPGKRGPLSFGRGGSLFSARRYFLPGL